MARAGWIRRWTPTLACPPVLPQNPRQLALHRLPCRSTSLRENLWRPAPTTDPVQMLGTRRQGGEHRTVSHHHEPLLITSTFRRHRPSFPFPPAGSSVYRAPDSMEDSTDLRKSISHRASVSQQHHHQQQQANFANGSASSIRPAQRWTRASFPFPENPDNGMGIRSGDTNQQ